MNDTAKIIISALIGGAVALAAYQAIKIIAGKKKPVDEIPETAPEIPAQIESEPADEKEFEQKWSGGHVYAEPGTYHDATSADIASIHPFSIISENPFDFVSTYPSPIIADKSRTDYTVYSKKDDDLPIKEISPDEFGEDPSFERVTWTYYTDGVMTDQSDHVIDNYADYVGDFKPLVGRFDPNVAYVRNLEKSQDYEILMSESSYEEIIEDHPYLRRELEDHD